MTGSTAIDVVISLVFIFLLYSLLASIIQEALTNILALRSKMLLKSIGRMLDDGDSKEGFRKFKFFNFFIELVKNIGSSFFYPFINRPLTKKFYEHPSIKYLSESSWNDKPAYLRAGTFAKTLYDMLKEPSEDGETQNPAERIGSTLRNDSSIPKETRRHLKILFENAGGDMEKFKFTLEEWFNEVQERATGWFKKQVQVMLFVIGLVLAYSFNVDTIAIARLLSTNSQVRERFVEFSLSHYKDVYNSGGIAKGDSTAAQEDIEKARKEVREAIDDANSILGLGRKDTCLQDCQGVKKEIEAVISDTTLRGEDKVKKLIYLVDKIETTSVLSHHQTSIGLAILGWVLTGFAISLGAPFWFDLLNKVSAIRSSIKPQTPPTTPPSAGASGIGVANVPPDKRVG